MGEAALTKPPDRPGALLAARLRGSLHHFSRESAAAAPRWAPVLSSARLELSFDLAARTARVDSLGRIELDLSARLLARLLAMQRRLSAPSVGGARLVGFAPFALQNETGNALLAWADDEPPAELPPGGATTMAASPEQLGRSGRRLHLTFAGFQQLDLRPLAPPYVRRCRVWPAQPAAPAAGRRAGRAPPSAAIVNVLLESRMVDGTEVLTLHSRFVVQNCCPAPARLRLVRKDGDAPLELSLAPRARLPIPLGYHSGWLRLAPPPGQDEALDEALWSRDEPGAGAGEAAQDDRLELSAACLEVLAGRGVARLTRGEAAAGACARRECYHVTASPTSRPPEGWLLAMHAPLLLLNGMLCVLEFELSEGAAPEVVEAYEAEKAAAEAAAAAAAEAGSAEAAGRTPAVIFHPERTACRPASQRIPTHS